MSGSDIDWTTWLEKHGAPLVAYARQYADTHADAEDIVQDAFLRFWQSRQRVADPKAYLYVCVRRSAVDWLRKKQSRVTTIERRQQRTGPDNEAFFDRDTAQQVEQQMAIETAMTNLPLEQRETLVMKIWGNLTFQQIGDVLGISHNTAASRYRYALASLQQHLSKEVLE